jgi:diguanylate cyclase (GGDEF)-like protein
MQKFTDRLYAIIYAKLSQKGFQNDNDVYLYLILSIAALFAMSMHVFLLFFFIALRVKALVIINICSMLLYVASFWLIQKKHYSAPGFLLTGEVIVYTFLSVYIVGFDNYIVFYFFLILIMQIIIPYAKGAARAGIVVFLGFCVIASPVIDARTSALIALGDANNALSYFNLSCAFIGALIELMVGAFINRVIAYYNNLKMESFRMQAYTDPLTGLFNRRYAGEYFRELAAAGTDAGSCIAMIDIDNFKKINDVYGHPVGDVLITHLSEHMRHNFRKSDVLFRWGGEEFLVILTDVTIEMAQKILEKLRKTIHESVFTAEKHILGFTVTIGVAELDFNNVEASINACDQNLYHGKENGKNQVVAILDARSEAPDGSDEGAEAPEKANPTPGDPVSR